MSEVYKFANESFHRKIACLETNACGGHFKVIGEGRIVGHWHEDGNQYEITCPPQLQDSLLVLLQNCGKLYFVDKS